VSTEESAQAAGAFVIPVRYVAGGEIVQTTSTAVHADAIHVRSVRPPQPGRVVGLQLYFPLFKQAVTPLSIVAERTYGANPGFWAEFAGNDGSKERIAALLGRHRAPADARCRRFCTRLDATIRERSNPQSDGYVTNVSQTGAFLKLESLPAKGSVVELDVAFPDDPTPDTVLAYVVHVAPQRGVGVQFVGASDEFRSRLDRHLAQLAAVAGAPSRDRPHGAQP
jgi:hypothetical protein